MITNISNDLKICGIYKINYDNGKIYIGQGLSIYARALEHNSKNIQICDKALKQHNATIEILEKVQDIFQLDELEDKWIDFYKATDKTVGYNILKNGNASGKRGVENCNASLTGSDLEKVIDLLINHTELTYEDIAHQFNVSKNTILKISKGYNYFNPSLNYPLRQNNHDAAKKDAINDYFHNETDILALKEDLFYRWDLEIEKDLIKKYNIPLKIIREINNGYKFAEIGNYTYPIRSKNIRNNNNFTQQDILNILSELKNSKKSMTDIGKKYGVHRDTISKINQGKAYIIKNYKYPAR